MQLTTQDGAINSEEFFAVRNFSLLTLNATLNNSDFVLAADHEEQRNTR